MITLVTAFATGIVLLSLYFIYRNSRTHMILISISNELSYEMQMAKNKDDVGHISDVLGKLAIKDHYTRLLFSFKPFNKLEYELRKEIGMPKSY